MNKKGKKSNRRGDEKKSGMEVEEKEEQEGHRRAGEGASRRCKPNEA